MGVLEFRVADLLVQDVDAIVNAANESLVHGGGIAALIARAAGPDLEEDSRRIGHCPTGGAVVTRPGRLPQRAVIHAVGPVWCGGGAGEAGLLAGCHRAVVAEAAARGFARVALPAISTGVFGYPVALAAPVAVGAAREALASAPGVEVVRFCFLDPSTCALYRAAAGPSAEPSSGGA